MPQINLSQNSTDSHQSTPWCLAAFFAYEVQDTYHDLGSQKSISKAMSVNKIIVQSDILSATVSTSKGGISCTAELVLASGVNDYSVLLCPGNHAMLWIHNDISKYDNVANAVSDGTAANKYNDGLKFVGRVNSVRQVLNTTPTGIKTIVYFVTMSSFTELNNMIYINPLLGHGTNDPATSAWVNLYAAWNQFATKFKNAVPASDVISFLIQAFVGFGTSKLKYSVGDQVNTPNDTLLIPKEVSKLLNIGTSSQSNYPYSSILQTIFGIQKYKKGSDGTISDFIPANVNDPSSMAKKCKQAVQGKYSTLSDNFQNVTLWSLLMSYLNPSLNEMYCTLRMNANGDVYPTLVVRQRPFTSKFFKSGAVGMSVTKFIDLPAWNLDNKIALFSYNLGTSNAMRKNFTQIYSSMLDGRPKNPQDTMQYQLLSKNSQADVNDIVRSGSYNAMYNTNCNVTSDPMHSIQLTDINAWAKLVSDWDINGHLKLTGSVTSAGIAEPVCIGDNLGFDQKIFHIEAIQHTYTVVETGMKSFYTTFSLSNGVSKTGDYHFMGNKTRADLIDNSDTNFIPGVSADNNDNTGFVNNTESALLSIDAIKGLA